MGATTIKIDNEVKDAFSKPATDDIIDKTVEALKRNGIETFVFSKRDMLRKKIFDILPEKAEVMNMSSVTLDMLAISSEILNSERYDPIRNKMKHLNKKEQRKEGACADYSIGSVHAVTESGEVLIASATGSQLSAYAYASGKIIWVVGTQKIVKDREQGLRRIYEYCFPLENERAKKVYNTGSRVGKILIINAEDAGRFTLLFLKENIGF